MNFQDAAAQALAEFNAKTEEQQKAKDAKFDALTKEIEGRYLLTLKKQGPNTPVRWTSPELSQEFQAHFTRYMAKQGYTVEFERAEERYLGGYDIWIDQM